MKACKRQHRYRGTTQTATRNPEHLRYYDSALRAPFVNPTVRKSSAVGDETILLMHMRPGAWIPEPLKLIALRALGLPRLRPIDRFLRLIPGLIHIGANSGQERHLYHQLGLHVLWIEADPEVFHRLCENTANWPRQRAINALLSNVEGAEIDFHIANNEGLSSSMFELAGHALAWPHVHYAGQRRLVARKLDQVLEEQRVDLSNYPALVLDVQGAELLVLSGAAAILPAMSWIRLPAADFDSYRGAPDIAEIGAFLELQGFTQVARLETAVFPGLGTTSEFLFQRQTRVMSSATDKKRSEAVRRSQRVQTT